MSRKYAPIARLIRPGGDLVEHVRPHIGLQLDDLERYATERTRRRLWVIIWSFTFIFAFLGARLAYLTTHTDTIQQATKHTSQKQASLRPIITDRQGHLLATHITTYTLGADAFAIKDAESVANELAYILPHMNLSRTRRLLATNRRYVELKRGLTPKQYLAVLNLGNPALKFNRDEKRVYPQATLAAHVLGFVSSDMRGLAGLEYAFDQYGLPATKNAPLSITLDIGVQHSVRAEMLAGMKKFKAKAASAIVMDIHTGNVLALVSLPDFDPNHPHISGQAKDKHKTHGAPHFNRATLGVYELGSIFKIFTAAMAFESGIVKQEDRFETALPLQIGRHIINDFHGQARPLTVHEIVVHSSNIGAAQLALATPPQTHREFLDRLGLTQRADFELPELAHPIMPDYWHDIQRATTAYGHGIAVSLLQALTAGAAMINGGILYRPRLIDDGAPLGVRVISENTSAHMRHIMRAVVTSGTASKANLSGFPILGKTGTADKVARGGYDSTRSIASFMGAFPAHAPQYAFIVMLDEPQALAETAGMATAGWNVVPIATNIVRRIAPLLDIMPPPQIQQAHQTHKDAPQAESVEQDAPQAVPQVAPAEIEQTTPALYEEEL